MHVRTSEMTVPPDGKELLGEAILITLSPRGISHPARPRGVRPKRNLITSGEEREPSGGGQRTQGPTGVRGLFGLRHWAVSPGFQIYGQEIWDMSRSTLR